MTSSEIVSAGSARALTSAEREAIQFTEALPAMMVSLLERRYLTQLQPADWQISPQEGDTARPLLSEITALGRPGAPDEWAQAMPQVLTACHDLGHAVVMTLHGDGTRHRLYLGARRLTGMGARSTEDYLQGQQSALKAYISGLCMSEPRRLDAGELGDLHAFLNTAPVLSVVTGIPSERTGIGALGWQSLDRLTRAVGNQRYVLQVVAEPVAPQRIDAAIDACRRLKSELHSYKSRSINRSKGGSAGESHSEQLPTVSTALPDALLLVGLFCSFAGMAPAGAAIHALSNMASPLSQLATTARLRSAQEQAAKQFNTGTNWSEGATLELLDANAEACELMLQAHIERLQTGRSEGWWQMASYIAAESDAAMHSVGGALRSLCSGSVTTQDPIRMLTLPTPLLRDAVRDGHLLHLLPLGSTQGHPLGETYDVLASCVRSTELAVLVNMPQKEIPGLPMRDSSDFALSAPPPEPNSIEIGILQDALGHPLGPVTLTADSLNRHVFVTGVTGSGKTNTCMQLLLETYHTLRVPFLVIEPAKAEYHRLAQTPELQGKLRVYGIGGDATLPFRLNPFAPMPGIPLSRHIDLLKAVFNASFPMFAGMTYVLEEAIMEVYTERGWNLFTSQNDFLPERPNLDEISALTPCLGDIHDKIETILERKSYGEEIQKNLGAALRSRLHSLMVGNKGLTLNTRRATPLEHLFDGPTVIELENLGDDEEKAFVMALLFVLLYEFAQQRQKWVGRNQENSLQHLTLIEEAHRLLTATHGGSAESGDPRGKAVTMFTDMLAEMRAYGEGFIIADQIPTKLAPETMKNSNVKIVHRLISPDDRVAAGSCINLTDPQIRYLNNLTRGLALVHDERIGEAVLTRIHPAKETRAPKLTPTEAKALLEKSAIGSRDYLRHHAGCHKCASPCAFFHRLDMLESPEAMARTLEIVLENALFDEPEQAWAAWRHWWSPWQVSRDAVRAEEQADIEGLAYCAAVNAAHSWLERRLLARRKQAGPQSSLTPGDRLSQETMSREVGTFVRAWMGRTEWDDEAQTRFAALRDLLRAEIASEPVREREGCAQCPVRCQALSFVTPALAALAPKVNPKLQDMQDAFLRLRSIEAVLDAEPPTELSSLLHAVGPRADTLHRGGLYCLLVNSAPPSGQPDAGQPARDALLELLRQPSDALAGASLSSPSALQISFPAPQP
jgi:DNA helicase HerA-like ATPase